MNTARERALARLRRELSADVEPVLSPPELDDILDGALLTFVWEAEREVEYGEEMVPTVRNGHRYKCLRPGVTGTTEPAFLESTQAVVANGRNYYSLGRSYEDGTVLWQETGQDYSSPYDLDAALEAGCYVKAVKCADWVDYSADGRSMSDHQVPEFWLKMAEKFKRAMIG